VSFSGVDPEVFAVIQYTPQYKCILVICFSNRSIAHLWWFVKRLVPLLQKLLQNHCSLVIPVTKTCFNSL